MITKASGIGMTSPRTRLRMIERLRAAGVRDEAVLAAMASVPRHIFVDEALSSRAYEDLSLPLGHGQTISHPLTVARMCELARGGRVLGRVLEVGTGCGYQAAVLSKFAREVFSIERIESLEQLRALWHGHRIAVMHTDRLPAAGVDTEADLARVRAHVGRA